MTLTKKLIEQIQNNLQKLPPFRTHKKTVSDIRLEADKLWEMFHGVNCAYTMGKNKINPNRVKRQTLKVIALTILLYMNWAKEDKETKWDDQPLGVISDHKIARTLGMSKETVRQQRLKRNIPPFQEGRRP